MVNRLSKWAGNRGYEIGWGPVAVLDDVHDDIDKRRGTGELDASFDRDHLGWYRHPGGIPIPDAKSVIVVSVPRPTHTVAFTLPDGPFTAVVPPTYVNFKGTGPAVQQDLAAGVFEGRHRLEVLPAPLKAVAARLGLVAYGRNNITYSARFGSYHQLVGLVTDAELVTAAGWRCERPEVLAGCESCQACRRACPTGTIHEDRFLLRAERCLSLYNENAGPWPEFVAPSAHHCLVGCLACQKSCPQNAGLYREESTGVTFSADETEALLAGGCGEARHTLDRGVVAKLQRLRMTESGMLGRNLRVLLDRHKCIDSAG